MSHVFPGWAGGMGVREEGGGGAVILLPLALHFCRMTATTDKYFWKSEGVSHRFINKSAHAPRTPATHFPFLSLPHGPASASAKLYGNVPSRPWERLSLLRPPPAPPGT